MSMSRGPPQEVEGGRGLKLNVYCSGSINLTYANSMFFCFFSLLIRNPLDYGDDESIGIRGFFCAVAPHSFSLVGCNM